MIEGYLDRQVYYRYCQAGASLPVLVFVHGLSGSCSAWRSYEDKFAGDFNLLFFDLRGHGLSMKKQGIDFYSLENLSGDIFRLCEKLQLRKTFLIGHSFGALVVLDFADKYPQMVEALVLLAPDYRINETFRAQIARPLLAVSRFLSLRPFRERFGTQIDYSKFINTGDWDLRRIYIDVKNTTLRVYFNCLRQARVFDGQKILPNIKIPTLIIHGDHDTIFPVSDSLKMAKKLFNARIKILVGAKHILVLNNRDEVAREIDGFVKSI